MSRVNIGKYGHCHERDLNWTETMGESAHRIGVEARSSHIVREFI
jgi:hypothetical protein